MNNVDVFFGGGDSGGSFPAMPRNVGHCSILGGNHMPAQKLITVSGAVAAGGVVTATATAHTLLVGSSGVIRISGANEAVFNGKHTYVVEDANTIVFNISSGSPATATGTLSVCVDIFEGDYFTLPTNFKTINVGTPIARINKYGAEIWAAALSTSSFDRYLGASLLPGGDLAICLAHLGGNAQYLTIAVYRFDKKTGAKTTLSSIQSYFGVTSMKVWPTKEYMDTHPQITVYGRESHIVYSTDTNDITRTAFEAVEENVFYLSACNYEGTSTGSSAIKSNVEVFFNASAWITCDVVTDQTTGLPVQFPIQYATKDRKIFIGKIYTRLISPNGSNIYKYFNVTRGGVSAIAYIPNDPSLCFLVDRHREVVTPANAWITLASVTEEPIKITAMPDHIFLTACPTDKASSTTNNTLLLGSNFMKRTEFDDWLNDVCDHLGLPE